MCLLGNVLQCWGSRYPLWVLFFPLVKTVGLGGLLDTAPCHPGLGVCLDQSKGVPLTLLMRLFSVFVVQGSASASSPRSMIFTVMSCLWIVST